MNRTVAGVVMGAVILAIIGMYGLKYIENYRWHQIFDQQELRAGRIRQDQVRDHQQLLSTARKEGFLRRSDDPSLINVISVGLSAILLLRLDRKVAKSKIAFTFDRSFFWLWPVASVVALAAYLGGSFKSHDGFFRYLDTDPLGTDGNIIAIQHVDALFMCAVCLLAPALFPAIMRYLFAFRSRLAAEQAAVDSETTDDQKVQRAKQARDDLKQLPSLCAVLYQLAMLPFTVASALFVFWWVLGMIFNESPDFWGPVIKPLVGFAFIVILMAPYWLSAILIWFLIERRWVQFEEIDWIAKLPLVFRKILGMVVSLGIYVEARFRRNVFRID